ERGVENRDAVAFAENEAVAVRPARILRIDAEELAVEVGEKIRHGQARADVRRIRSRGHPQRVRSQRSRQATRLGSKFSQFGADPAILEVRDDDWARRRQSSSRRWNPRLSSRA